ncbi:hypothetical protein NECAME_12909 [Necator americanus]|uniref:Uncharacterized protein n=1 Tax=Necator americanus TaxID=51031 RepID=W2SZX2_NECAM|nr:hypothetical protein NECAME_12909 [Necator americanus]ETN74566.1 hypothetical protein NECAME_12909 [Necator americanus]
MRVGDLYLFYEADIDFLKGRSTNEKKKAEGFEKARVRGALQCIKNSYYTTKQKNAMVSTRKKGIQNCEDVLQADRIRCVDHMLSTTASSQKPISEAKRYQLMMVLGLRFVNFAVSVFPFEGKSSSKEAKFRSRVELWCDNGSGRPFTDDDVILFKNGKPNKVDDLAMVPVYLSSAQKQLFFSSLKQIHPDEPDGKHVCSQCNEVVPNLKSFCCCPKRPQRLVCYGIGVIHV